MRQIAPTQLPKNAGTGGKAWTSLELVSDAQYTHHGMGGLPDRHRQDLSREGNGVTPRFELCSGMKTAGLV